MAEYKPGHQALRKGRSSISNQIYLVTATTRDRANYFTDHKSARLAAACFEDHQLLSDARMLAWVLMPDHAHWLIQLGERISLSPLIRRIKSSSALQVNKVRQTSGKVWEKGFHDHALRKEENLVATARYIVANPLRAGLVDRIGDYPYWNAIWIG